MRIVHHIFEEVWSKHTSADQHWSALNHLTWRGNEPMSELGFQCFMLDHLTVVIYCSSFRMRFYIKIKCIVGSFHIHRSSLWLIQRWPLIPLVCFGRVESLHIFRWFLHDSVNVEGIQSLLSLQEIVVDDIEWLAGCPDAAYSGVQSIISKPQSSLPVKKSFALAKLLFNRSPFIVCSFNELWKILLVVLHAVLSGKESLAPKTTALAHWTFLENADGSVHFEGVVSSSHTYAASSDYH